MVSVEEYLRTSYNPDVEFVDGVLVERSIGEWLHSLVQSNLILALSRKYPKIIAVPALRTKTATTRYRIPDVTVVLRAPQTEYLLNAAFLVIEILSEVSMSMVTVKLKEYASKGVPNIWVVDPREKTMWVYRPPALVEMEGETIATIDGTVELTRDEIFAD